MKNKINKFIYSLITGLAMVSFWRGVWGLLDYYLFPNNEPLSYLVSFLIGLIILYLNDFSISELGSRHE